VILDSKSRRRWFGALCLLAAIGMLVAGETILKERLSQLAFVLYWLSCFGFTVLAIFTALADARALQQEGRDQQRALLESTLGKIERKKSPPE
jgi:4-hydroxybenzoate polyprenyltransferase